VTTRIRSGLCALTCVGMLAGCVGDQRVAEIEHTRQIEKAHLENFDDLDFNVYSGQKWDQLGGVMPRTLRSTNQTVERPRASIRTSKI
jgi:hypothetical protein